MESLCICGYVLQVYPMSSILWSVIILVSIFWIIKLIIQNIQNKKEVAKRQKGLEDYCQKRSDFYRGEREKILEKFRQKAELQGKLTNEDFAELKYLLEINGADEGDWLDEYEKFREEFQQQ